MAVTVTAKSGFDPDYTRRAAARPVEQSPLGYYANAAQKGEAPGRWFGAGAEVLGLAEGETVDLDDDGKYTAVYSQIHPVTGAKLGRAPVSAQDSKTRILADLLEQEPEATRQRHFELAREAAHLSRQSAPFTDVTVSISKSISVLHASIRENERQALDAGDDTAAAYWAAMDHRLQDLQQAANLAALQHAEKWMATRTGYHGSADKQETGRWDRARIVVSSWLQGTSRDGDPHDHIHNLFARVAQSASDGKWRALDTYALRNQLPAMQAIAAAHLESAMTREFGVEWVARADGAGSEIRGVTQPMMDEYSSRKQAIEKEMPARIRAFKDRWQRMPNQRELLYLRNKAWEVTRDAKPEAPVDWRAFAQEWDARAGGKLASVAPAVTRMPGHGAAPRMLAAPDGPGTARIARNALAKVQSAHDTWSKADYMKYLGLASEGALSALGPDEAVAWLHQVTDRAVRGEFGAVRSLDAPSWLKLPPSLIRQDLDGRSVFTRPGGERYATRVQLTLEEQLVQDAARPGAPRLSREDAARLLGADADDLDAQLLASAQTARDAVTGSRLRLDQAAALYYTLTSGRTADVLIGPAGSGKTTTVAKAAQIWREATGCQVFGTATSQAARNVLKDAGIQHAENTTVFLYNLPGRTQVEGRTSRPPRSGPAKPVPVGARMNPRRIEDLRPGSLIIVDESSMTSNRDLADIAASASRNGCKVLFAGDIAQLAAVEGGGGLSLLANRHGYVQLAEAVRFTEQWEQDASLRLRAGNRSALEEYAEHGRIRGGEPEYAMDLARRLYVADYVQGKDVELIAWAKEHCAEMSRRIRDDLLHLGVVQPGPEVSLANGARASAGDVIVVRKDNYHKLGIHNGQSLKIETINDDGTLTVRAKQERDPVTGQATWSQRTVRYAGYHKDDLGYASTAHSAQGRTVTSAITLMTGAEPRQWFYSGMTRGADSNIACVFGTPARLADPAQGTRPAPEIGRHERLLAERAGEDPQYPDTGLGAEPRDLVAVLADALERDGAELSALETQQRNLANADHLGQLNAMWNDIVGGLDRDRYQRMFMDRLSPADRERFAASKRETWLWRSMRQAEAAGLDAAQVAERAVTDPRGLADARDLGAVLDKRVRGEVAGLAYQWRSWRERVPAGITDPQLREFVHALAEAMDNRKARLGEYMVRLQPQWLRNAIGAAPADPVERVRWQDRAANIATYRELYGWDHEHDPVGLEPSGDATDMRAAWLAAHGAITRTDEVQLGEYPDERLQRIRGTYADETGWAPLYVADRLRVLRTGIIDADAKAARSDAEGAAAQAKGDHGLSARHTRLAESAREAAAHYRQRETADAELADDYAAWSRVTAGSRHLAVLADTELRRRHPDQKFEPLRTAEPEAPAAELPARPVAREDDGESRQRQRAEFRQRLEERQGVQVPAVDPDEEPEGEAWPAAYPQRDRDAVLQPPKPEIEPAPDVQRAAGREAVT